MTASEMIPVYKRGCLLAVHTDVGGDITLTVENKYTRAKALFTDKEYDIKDGKFVYMFESPDTALFALS